MFKHFGTFWLIAMTVGCSSTGSKPDPIGSGSSSGNGSSGAPNFFQKLQGNPPKSNNPPAPAPVNTSNASTGNGILAGQVMDHYHRRPGGATIQVVDLQNTGANAVKTEVVTDAQGYFNIRDLKPGVNYQLIARGKEGNKVFSGTALVIPPNPRVTIFVTVDGSADSSPVANDPATDGKSQPTPDKARTADAAPPQDQSTNTTSLPQADRIARETPIVSPGAILSIPPIGGGQGGYAVPPTPNLPTIGNIIPIKPGQNSSSLPANAFPNASQSFTPVPSCVLVGQKLENFSLHDMNGQVWEYKKNKVGRMVLLDFWFSSCGPCLQAIPHVVELQKRYKSFGLEVVGIAYEKGDPVEKVQKVRPVRARYHMNYMTLFGGDGPEPCPVRTQFDVTSFPCLVLLDEDGNIVWRNQKDEGVDQRQLGELELEIRRGLGIRSR